VSIRYLTLIKFTDEGVRHAANSVKRAEEFRAAVEATGGTVVNTYWAVGSYDGCVTFDAPDEKTATKLLIKLAQQGFVRTKTLRVFEANEFADAVG
jgi:uncharacterized protein with GYD domain